MSKTLFYMCRYLQFEMKPLRARCLLLKRRKLWRWLLRLLMGHTGKRDQCSTPFLDRPDDCRDAE